MPENVSPIPETPGEATAPVVADAHTAAPLPSPDVTLGEHEESAPESSSSPDHDEESAEVEHAHEPELETAPTQEETKTPDQVAEPVAEPVAEIQPEEPPVNNKRWYVVKVQSGREESIKEAIERRVKIEGLEEFYGQIVIPVEITTELRNGKRIKRTHKLYPGYLMAEVEFNNRILYLFRETSGVGDFVGAGVDRPPPPMSPREVESMLSRQGTTKEGVVKQTKPKFDRGDRVRVKDGTFASMEGEVKEIVAEKNIVKVELTIFGRPVPVELEYWQVEPV